MQSLFGTLVLSLSTLAPITALFSLITDEESDRHSVTECKLGELGVCWAFDSLVFILLSV